MIEAVEDWIPDAVCMFSFLGEWRKTKETPNKNKKKNEEEC